MSPQQTICRQLLLLFVLTCTCQGRRLPAAAVLPGFGKMFGKDEKGDDGPLPARPGQDRGRPPKRPPPPPPRTEQQKGVHEQHGNPQAGDESVETGDITTTKDGHGEYQGKKKPPPPPPRLQQYEYEQQQQQQEEEQMWDPYNPFGGFQQPPGWGGSPPEGMWGAPLHGDWMQQPPLNDDFQNMQREIEDRIVREHDLIQQIQNLTASLATVAQREDLHVRQLDVLTERVMDAEAAAASERNELQEYRANCTELGRTIATMQDELEEWKNRCEILNEQHVSDEERVKEILETLKERDSEVEELASSIETARLSTEREKYLAARQTKKKRGFLAWLFGIGQYESDDDEERLQELAKSTLLRALQRERNNVDELEAAVFTLQQNNSAISEMVESRDMLINELNDRVAVFEEDKVVLKAALRQLQKEMRDEAPRTQKLIDDLQRANEEINDLNEEIQSLLCTHRDEIVLLQKAIVQKQAAINETESNLTVIGTYVDKLEERLAMFAISRRDMDIREQRCKEIEERSVEAELERDAMKQRVEAFTVEHEDLKKLLDELVRERSALLSETEALRAERDKLRDGESSFRETITSLEQDVSDLDRVAKEWRSQVIELELLLEEEADQARQAREKYDDLEIKFNSISSAPKVPMISDDKELDIHTDDDDLEAGESSSVLEDEFHDVCETIKDLESTKVRVDLTPPPPLLTGSSDSTMASPDANSGRETEVPPKRQFIPPSKWFNSFSRKEPSESTAPIDGRPPLLPGSKSGPNKENAEKRRATLMNRQDIPFRKWRKFVSQRTGMHGVFTPSSRQLRPPPPLPPPGKQGKGS